VTLNDSKIFNDTEHRAASSRQLSFLLNHSIARYANCCKGHDR